MDMTLDEADILRARQLRVLRYHWDSAYRISFTEGMFVAERRDNSARVRQPTADRLREAVIDDYRARPVPRQSGWTP